MGFRLVPKSVTLNDLERHNGRYLAFLTESVDLGTNYAKVVEDRTIQSVTEMYPTNLVFSDMSFMAIFAEVTENERMIERHTCAIYIHFSVTIIDPLKYFKGSMATIHLKVIRSRFDRNRLISTIMALV